MMQTNTTIKFQVATLAKSPADGSLAPWIANSNFLIVLAMGPIFVSTLFTLFSCHSLTVSRDPSVIATARSGLSWEAR